MKKNIINKLTTILMSLFVLMAISCSTNITLDFAKVTFSVDSDVSARTVLPDVDVSALTNLKLYKTEVKDENLLGKYDSLAKLNEAELLLEVGEYTFILTAEKGGTAFTGSTKATLEKGTNNISFALAINNYGTGTGDVEITLAIPTTKELVKAKYEFVNTSDISDYYAAEIGEQTIKGEKILYSNDRKICKSRYL